ncbi:hypothetical protein ACP3TC_01825 [Winslowiella sp. 2C04]|uniref:hypothetical protein n=1 Tax=Winslowiella sp. 2C04 TaxID=3416179 RepID=UPI003CEA9985
MHIPPFSPRQWGLNQRTAEEHHPSDEQEQQRFSSLMGMSPKKRDTSSTIASGRGSDTLAKTFHWEGANDLPLTSDWRMKESLTSSWLRWRLTNGPLAGLEIEACYRNDDMSVRLRTQDLEPLLRRMGSARQLEQQLATQFNCHVTVEINDADRAAE